MQRYQNIVVAAALAAASAGCVHRPGCTVARPYDRAAVADLECAATTGDKFAELELGRRYEEGIGVPRDVRRAKRYYSRAATPTSGTIQVYSPPVGKERYGRILTLNGPRPAAPGLPEARARLARLRAAENGDAAPAAQETP